MPRVNINQRKDGRLTDNDLLLGVVVSKILNGHDNK